MITALFNYKPKGLKKEEVITEFENLFAWEQIEVLEYLEHLTRNERSVYLKDVPTNELCDELQQRGIEAC